MGRLLFATFTDSKSLESGKSSDTVSCPSAYNSETEAWPYTPYSFIITSSYCPKDGGRKHP
jgi:hypothetical protein